MQPELLNSLNEKSVKLRDADIGPQAEKAAAILNAEIQMNLMAELNNLKNTLDSCTSKTIESNEKTSEGSEKFAKSLSVATWVLAGSTIALVVVTVVAILK